MSCRQATQEPGQDCTGYGEDEGCGEEGQEEIRWWRLCLGMVVVVRRGFVEAAVSYSYGTSIGGCIMRRLGKEI